MFALRIKSKGARPKGGYFIAFNGNVQPIPANDHWNPKTDDPYAKVSVRGKGEDFLRGAGLLPHPTINFTTIEAVEIGSFLPIEGPLEVEVQTLVYNIDGFKEQAPGAKGATLEVSA